jgi:hypothetical protein
MEVNFDKFRIRRLDPSNIVIEHLKKIKITIKGKQTGEIKNEWIIISYHGSLKNALLNLVKEKISNEDFRSINQVLEEIKKLENIIKNLDLKEI